MGSATRDKARDALLVLAALGGTKDNRFGKPGEVDTISWLLGTAAGWGGNPPRDAMYEPGFPAKNDGATAYEMTLREVPVDGFSLHAAVRVEANDCKRLEQLCRYITRPALSDERVQLNAGWWCRRGHWRTKPPATEAVTVADCDVEHARALPGHIGLGPTAQAGPSSDIT